MKLHELTEGIEDNGIFKAVFMAGMPGAGKSTVAQKITDGAVSPKMINVDKAFEFLSNKRGNFPDSAAWALVGDQSKIITKNQLAGYLNGMLPMYVDGTGGNSGAVARRKGILESVGYDTMMIWVDVSLETAIERVNSRAERQVDIEHVTSVYNSIAQNRKYYQSTFGGNFMAVDNNGTNFDETAAYSAANKFFTSPIENPNGIQHTDTLRETGAKVLVPTIYPPDYLKKMVDIWFVR